MLPTVYMCFTSGTKFCLALVEMSVNLQNSANSVDEVSVTVSVKIQIVFVKEIVRKLQFTEHPPSLSKDI